MTENPLAVLLEEFKDAFSDWESAFTITGELNEEDVDDEDITYLVTVKHDLLDKSYYFMCVVDDEGNCEFECGDDSWCKVTTANVFMSLWFDAVYEDKL